MKDESVALDTEIVENRLAPRRLGIAFNHATLIKGAPLEARAGVYEKAEVLNEERYPGGVQSALGNFLKPTVSNLFLLGCLLGLFVLYCCSCVIHALTFPARRKSS